MGLYGDKGKENGSCYLGFGGRAFILSKTKAQAFAELSHKPIGVILRFY